MTQSITGAWSAMLRNRASLSSTFLRATTCSVTSRQAMATPSSTRVDLQREPHSAPVELARALVGVLVLDDRLAGVQTCRYIARKPASSEFGNTSVMSRPS